MKIKYDDYFNNGVSWQTRATVWCLFSDLVDNGDDTYGLVDGDVAKTLGFGSEIIVINRAGMFLFWNGDDMAYDWGKYDGGGDEPPAGYVTVAPKQSVTVVDDMVAITLAEGITMDFSDQESWPLADYMAGNCIVKLNDTEATYNIENATYSTTEDTTTLACFPDEEVLYFCADDAETQETIIPGTYTVAIYAPEARVSND